MRAGGSGSGSGVSPVDSSTVLATRVSVVDEMVGNEYGVGNGVSPVGSAVCGSIESARVAIRMSRTTVQAGCSRLRC